MKNGGGHFAPKLDGKFELELGVQYHWNLQCIIVKDKFNSIVELNLTYNTNFSKIRLSFLSFITSKYSFSLVSGKLENWFNLSFADFIKELNKVIKTSV